MPSDIEVLVVGAGACGMAAAIAAHDGGANVAIIEKMDRPGGNSSLSTGSVPAAGSKYQKAAGIDDKPEAMVERPAGHLRRYGRARTGAAAWRRCLPRPSNG